MAGLPSFGESFSEAFNATYGGITRAKRDREASMRADRQLKLAEAEGERSAQRFARETETWANARGVLEAYAKILFPAGETASPDMGQPAAPAAQPTAQSAAAIGLPANPSALPTPQIAKPVGSTAAGLAAAGNIVPTAPAAPPPPPMQAGIPAPTGAATPAPAPQRAAGDPGSAAPPPQQPPPFDPVASQMVDPKRMASLNDSSTLGKLALAAFKFGQPEAMQLWQQFSSVKTKELQTQIMIAAQGGDKGLQEWADSVADDGASMKITPSQAQKGWKTYEYQGIRVDAPSPVKAATLMSDMMGKDPQAVTAHWLQFNRDAREQLGLESEIQYRNDTLALRREELANDREYKRQALALQRRSMDAAGRAASLGYEKGRSVTVKGPNGFEETVSVYVPTQPGMSTLWQGTNFNGLPVSPAYYNQWSEYQKASVKYGVPIETDGLGKPYFVRGKGDKAVRIYNIADLDPPAPRPGADPRPGSAPSRTSALGAAIPAAVSGFPY